MLPIGGGTHLHGKWCVLNQVVEVHRNFLFGYVTRCQVMAGHKIIIQLFRCGNDFNKVLHSSIHVLSFVSLRSLAW
jgi:hypothetical protein